jgi:NAD(P)-dependent dehydrogenase (short-subunit alcohol dehydrogenase family)
MELNGRVALVTGTRRIGGVVAKALASRGADVAIVYNRSAMEAEAAASDVRAQGRRALVLQADVANAASVSSLIGAVDGEWGRLDVLVNMASLYRNVTFDQMTPASWQEMLSVDLDGTFLCSHAAVPVMRRTGGGRIINFSDWLVASERPRYKGYLGYYVAKAGVKALTEALALELAPDQILVNAIAPGPILAPPDTTDEESDAVARATPLGKWGGPEEIAKVVLALVESDFITGETVRVDGGRHIH